MLDLAIGAQVNYGTAIGISGTTGNAGGQGITPHVHIGIHKIENGISTRVNPADYTRSQINPVTGATFNPLPCITN